MSLLKVCSEHQIGSTNNPTTFSALQATLFILIAVVSFLLPNVVFAECIEGDCVNGQGTFLWPNGDRFVGNWKNGKWNGEGTFIWPEGDSYSGKWINGEKSGHGRYIYPEDTNQHHVEFANTMSDEVGCIEGDCVNGFGTYTWLSGTKYVGEFVNGKRNGLGVYSLPNGYRIIGIWSDGKFIGNEKSHLSKWAGG